LDLFINLFLSQISFLLTSTTEPSKKRSVNPNATKTSHPETASSRFSNGNLCDSCREIDFARLWDPASD
jgi:hypothetical protein